METDCTAVVLQASVRLHKGSHVQRADALCSGPHVPHTGQNHAGGGTFTQTQRGRGLPDLCRVAGPDGPQHFSPVAGNPVPRPNSTPGSHWTAWPQWQCVFRRVDAGVPSGDEGLAPLDLEEDADPLPPASDFYGDGTAAVLRLRRNSLEKGSLTALRPRAGMGRRTKDQATSRTTLYPSRSRRLTALRTMDACLRSS